MLVVNNVPTIQFEQADEDVAAESAANRIANRIGGASSASGTKASDKDTLLKDLRALQQTKGV
jgi:hypothetical protein